MMPADSAFHPGSEWIMHAKSGYTAYRVATETAAEYYHVHQEASLVVDLQRSFAQSSVLLMHWYWCMGHNHSHKALQQRLHD